MTPFIPQAAGLLSSAVSVRYTFAGAILDGRRHAAGTITAGEATA
jgi:hypothetical protein